MIKIHKMFSFILYLYKKILLFHKLHYLTMADLIRIYNAGDKTITREEMAAVCYTMLFAGHETTSNVLAEGIRLMLTHRHSWEAVCADPSLIPRAVDEMLRYTPSIFAWRRITTEPVTLGGVDLPADAPLVSARERTFLVTE